MLNILKQLNNITGQINQLKDIPVVEKDLLLEKIRELYLAVLGIDQRQQIREKEETFELEQEITEEPQKLKTKPSKTAEQQKTPPAEEKISEATILAERFQGEKTFINERLAQQANKEDLSTKLQSKPIDDIANAIGINDKYKLIRELFNGKPEIFNQTIEKLNTASNFNEAFNYISSNFEWEMEDEPVQFLLDLVRRKFITDKNG